MILITGATGFVGQAILNRLTYDYGMMVRVLLRPGARADVLPIEVPPLRDHREDVPDLLDYYVNHLVDKENLPYRRFSTAAQNYLRNYAWPGNVRELKNVVQRLLILGTPEDVTQEEVESALSSDPRQPQGALPGFDLPLREAREMFESALAVEPWNRDALLGLADLEYRRGRYDAGLAHVTRVLQLDTYDAAANFVAGILYGALGRETDAREAYGWAARSMAHRSAAYAQLAELALADGDLEEATRYARLATDYDRRNIPARQVLAMVGRRGGDAALAASMREGLLELDPLHHFVAAEIYLAERDGASADALSASLRSEYPDQTILELAVDYVRRGASDDARALLQLGARVTANPLGCLAGVARRRSGTAACWR